MDKRLLDILCCPATKAPVIPLTKAQLAALNKAIESGSVQTVAATHVGNPLQAGLLTTDGKRIYRIEDDIPVMLSDEAIATTQIENFPIH
ncbi:MAG TPA: Trm112 family protein [Rudaea sp.]|nr:Trm112 family protein [Rudaea sp.]